MDILNHVDHTLLSANSTWEEIRQVVVDSKDYGCASACIPPYYVKRAKEEIGARITTVISFPLGYQDLEIKVREAEKAVADGADEIDMVMNISAFKSGDYDYVQKEIEEVKRIIGPTILKVIVETCYLDSVEKVTACKLVERAGGDFIKTSTGFGPGGASMEDLKLFKKTCPDLKVKVAGGISSLEEAREYIRMGADRLGSSKLVELKKNER